MGTIIKAAAGSAHHIEELLKKNDRADRLSGDRSNSDPSESVKVRLRFVSFTMCATINPA